MFTRPCITERGIDSLLPEADRWLALERRLERFCAQVRKDPEDESDEGTATRNYLRRLAEADLLGLVVPQQFGGESEQVSAVAVCLARQWLSRESGALDTAFVMQGLGSFPLVLAEHPSLREKLLPSVVRGQTICAFAITEPEAGSDVSRMQTWARSGDDGVVLEGTKTFISNAGIADSYVVFAREAEDASDGKARFGAFWVPGDAKGLRIEPLRVLAPHPIGSLHFEGVFVPTEHRVGAPGEGLRLALANLDQFRTTVGAAALGLADRAMVEATGHLGTRVQFGKPLAKQQGLRFRWAELATAHLAAQLLVYRAAAARDRGQGSSDAPAMAKLMATETAQKVVDEAVQSLGGRGVLVGETVERLYREVRALRIYEGTSEIQKLVIARSLFA